MEDINFDGVLAAGGILLMAFLGFIIFVISLLRSSIVFYKKRTFYLFKRYIIASLILIMPLLIYLTSASLFGAQLIEVKGTLDAVIIIFSPILIITLLYFIASGNELIKIK